MKLSHLAFGIVLIIAVIVAAIIAAFSVVTFDSLDKAVKNSMSSEIDFVKSSVQGLLDRTVRPGKAMRELFLNKNLTYNNLPYRAGSANAGQVATQLDNWTDALEILSATHKANADLAAYTYQSGKSPYTGVWADFVVQQDASTGDIIFWVPDMGYNTSYLNGTNAPPFDLTITRNEPYDSAGGDWQILSSQHTQATWNDGAWSSATVYFDVTLQENFVIMTYSLPNVFNASGACIAASNIDVNVGLVNKVLQDLATKDNKMFIVDARQTNFYNGALLTSSLPTSQLPLFDPATSLPYFPTSTPNGEVNGIMGKVFEEYGGFENIKTATHDIIIENYEDNVVVAAHIYAPGNFHWLVVSAVPRDYYYGSTTSAIGGTIGGGIALLILASALIIYIMLEQQKLVDGSRQSAEISQTVARNLVMYDTENASIVIEKALQPTIEVVAGTTTDADGNEIDVLREETNYSNRDLVLALKQINENLQVYKPHLPEYVLPQKVIDEQEEDRANGKAGELDEELLEMNDDGHLQNSTAGSSVDTENNSGAAMGGSHRRNNKRLARSTSSSNGGGRTIPVLEDVYKKKNANVHTFEVNMDDGRGGAVTRDDDTNNSKNSKNSKQSGTNISANNTTNSSTQGAAPIAKLALARHAGDTVDRVVMANLNLSRAHEVLFPTSAFVTVSKTVSINNVNKLIENILESASANDATVHSIIGDNITATWNATNRTVHADVKAMRFVTTVDNLVKKELHDLYKGGGASAGAGNSFNANAPPGQTESVSAFHDPHRFVVSGGVVNGSAWCQLAGSTKRQQFTLLNFSEAPVLSTVTELGHKSKFVAVCRTINQNCQHEFVFRGASVHILPGNENVLFPNTHVNLVNNNTQGNDVHVSSVKSNDGKGNASTSNMPSASMSNNQQTSAEQQQKQQPPKKTRGKSILALPVYELCSRKNLTAEDEWLYVVGDESKNKNAQAYSADERKQNIKKEQQHQQQLATFFNELVLDIARGNADKARSDLAGILEFDQEAQFLPAYQNLKNLVRRM